MRDAAPPDHRPIGVFVHHQGRGHAVRTAAWVNALHDVRPVTIFCARPDIFPPLRRGVTIEQIPSLFEPTGAEAPGAALLPTPDTVHCAPVGWPGIRRAMGTIAAWMRHSDPALFVSDVSAEVAQLARLLSVPHVVVLQHGKRDDPGHAAARDGAAGLLAPFHASLGQPDWPDRHLARTHFAAGLGSETAMPDRGAARASLGLRKDDRMVLFVSGGGGSGLTLAPIGVAARSFPDWQWHTIGRVVRDWHATEPPNVRHEGWVENPETYIAAADLVVSSTGNTTCQQVLQAARPWIVVPEWRYFDEQVEKARALAAAGVALHLPHLPSRAQDWRAAVTEAEARHDPASQAALLGPDPASGAARWIENLISELWSSADVELEAMDAQ